MEVFDHGHSQGGTEALCHFVIEIYPPTLKNVMNMESSQKKAGVHLYFSMKDIRSGHTPM